MSALSAAGRPGPIRLVAVESHPIQYKAPLFRALAADPRFDFQALYAMLPDARAQGAGFGVAFEWDAPLLQGYRHERLVNVARAPSVVRFGGCDTPGIGRWLKAHRPDVVLVNGWVVKTCLQALIACRRLGIPCMVRGEANLLRPRARWKHALHRLLLTQYSAYLAIGSANRAFYQFHRRPEARIFPAPYAVDNAGFLNRALELKDRRPALREAFGLPAQATVFLFAGKLEPKKHPQDLLEAVARLPEPVRARMAVLVVGDGPLRRRCEDFARGQGLPVVFAGFLNQSNMPDAYAACDALVLPSDAGETWGLVVNEAMASGRPALVSRSAGCREDLIVEGETGFSFPVGDDAALANCLRRYVDDAALAERQGQAALRHIARFDIAHVVEGVHEAASQCAARTRKEDACNC